MTVDDTKVTKGSPGQQMTQLDSREIDLQSQNCSNYSFDLSISFSFGHFKHFLAFQDSLIFRFFDFFLLTFDLFSFLLCRSSTFRLLGAFRLFGF